MPDEPKEAPTITIDPHPQCSYIDAVHGARCVRRDDSHLEHWIPVMQGDAKSAPPLTLPTGKVTDIDAVVRAIEEAGLLFSGCGCRGDHCPCSEARERMREVIGKHLREVTEEMLRAALTAIFEQHDEEDSEAIERDDEPAELARLLYEALKGEK